jgi:hypothetical protein
MEIVIIKTPPAPSMDGFDVGGFRAGRRYVVEERVGRYLIVAGYAEPAVRIAPTNPLRGEQAES